MWGTYFGGYSSDFITGTCTDKQNNIYITGYTSSGTQIATPGAWQTWTDTLIHSSFLAKFTPTGQLVWGTYLGFLNLAAVVNIDADENIYVYGATDNDTLLASSGTHQSESNGSFDAFLMKFDTAGQRIWGTLYGGEGTDGFMGNNYQGMDYMLPVVQGSSAANSSSISFNSKKDLVYICGGTTSQQNIAFGCDYEGKNSKRGYIAAFNSNTGTINWSSYHDAAIADMAYDGDGNFYLVGWTDTDSIASPGSYQEHKNSTYAVFFGKVTEQIFCPEDTISFIKNQDTLIADTGYVIYNWYKDAALVQSGSSNKYLINNVNGGTYKVEVSTDCHCLYISDTMQLQGTGIKNELTQQLQLQLSPNPASDNIILQGQVKNPQIINYTVIDILGKTHLSESFSISGNFSQMFYIKSMPAGSYILQVNNGKASSNFRFMKF